MTSHNHLYLNKSKNQGQNRRRSWFWRNSKCFCVAKVTRETKQAMRWRVKVA